MKSIIVLLVFLSFGVASANGHTKEHCAPKGKVTDKLDAAKKKAMAKEFATYGEFEYWTLTDNLAEAEKVFKKLKTDEKRQEAVDALANKYVEKGDFKSALRWAEKIKDEACKRQAIEGISTEAYRAMKKRLSAEDLVGAEDILTYIQHPYRRASAINDLVIRYVDANNFGQAKAWAKKIADNEKNQLALYYIAVEGYAARGEMEKAFATLDEEIVPLFGENGENRAVPRREHILKDMAATAAANKYDLPEATARGNVLKALSRIGDIYYGLMALESAVLRMASIKTAEALLADAGYQPAHDTTSEDTGTKAVGKLTVVSYDNEAKDIVIFVRYGIEEGTGLRPFRIDRWLDKDRQKEFDASMKDDEQLKKYLAEQKKSEEEQKAAEKDLSDRYQKFLEDPTDPANKFMAPDPVPAAPQGDHSGHEGHGGMHH